MFKVGEHVRSKISGRTGIVTANYGTGRIIWVDDKPYYSSNFELVKSDKEDGVK